MADRRPPSPEKWQRAVGIFERALELPDESREALIASETGGDDELARTVRGMLAADSSDADIIDRGIDGVADIAAASPPDHPLELGDVLGNFEVIGELGRGGMGIVYAARDRHLGRIAALKLLPAGSAQDPSATERLLTEAQAASALDHPNVATIYQVGEHEGKRFIAMARYEGETLRERLSRGPIAVGEAVNIAKQVAEGLAAAHAAGLVHRDVKPANIFLTRNGLVKLLDFGIATLIGPGDADGTIRGTVRYMSPEQARGGIVGERSDLWSLGAVLFEMITGRPLIQAGTAEDVIASLTAADPISLDAIPVSLRPALSRVLEKDSLHRTPSARELISDLDRVTRPRSSAKRSLIAASVMLTVATIAGIGWMSTRDDASAPVVKPTISVLPVSGTTESDEVSIASGLIDEVSARLIGLGRARVTRASDRSARQPPGTHYLQVNVRPRETGALVEVALERANDGQSVFRATRRLDPRDLRELSRTLVIDILTALGTPPSEKERSQIGAGFPSSAEAYREFLLGNQLLSIRTPAAVESALVHYRRAAQLDTTYAAAYARQSYAYSLLVDWGWKIRSFQSSDPIGAGLELANRAVALDSTSAEPWLARAYILVQRDPHRFEGAVEAFQHAITLDPYNAEAFHQYGQTLMALGRFTEAMAAYRRVLDLEPDRAMTLVPMGAIHKRQGRVDEGLRYLDSAIIARPEVAYARSVRSFHRSFMGDAAGAKADAEEALRLDSSFRIPALAALAKASWLLGDSAGARAAVRRAIESIAQPGVPSPTESFMISIAHVTMGRVDLAEEMLRSARPRGAWLWFYYMQPELDEFRRLPGPSAILAEADPRTPR